MKSPNADYFLPRDFEYAQPLYDLAYLLQIDALVHDREIPEYRTFALWKAALGIDGYTTNVAKWLGNGDSGELLDYEPSSRIKSYLALIAETGTVPELQELASPVYEACLRLRAIRGLGLKQIAAVARKGFPSEEWLTDALKSTSEKRDSLVATWEGASNSYWEAAHIVPPLLRLANVLEKELGPECVCHLADIGDGLSPIADGFTIQVRAPHGTNLRKVARQVARLDPFFVAKDYPKGKASLAHRLGWKMLLEAANPSTEGTLSISALAAKADLLMTGGKPFLRGDLHSHTNWSDGAAALQTMAEAAEKRGLEYIAVTDHSRSSKLQNGLNPVAWLRQAVSLSMVKPGIKVLHGIEADILPDGSLDQPAGLLEGMDIVVGSVHTSWGASHEENTSPSCAASASPTSAARATSIRSGFPAQGRTRQIPNDQYFLRAGPAQMTND